MQIKIYFLCKQVYLETIGVLNKIEKIVDVIFEDESTEKGDNFERYVVNLFNKKYFTVSEWTSDISRKHDRFIESDSNPDLVMRYKYKDRNELFCVECKFRSNLYQKKIQWSTPKQLERYRNYEKEKNLPFFIVIGLGGKPNFLKECFVFLLKKLNILHFIPVCLKNLNVIQKKIFSGEREYYFKIMNI